MVRTLTLVTVRQQQDNARVLAPLLLGRRNVLIDDALGPVCEVTELGLPQHQGILVLYGVAVLEAHRCVLAEQRVIDVELALLVGEVAKRHPLLTVFTIVEDSVTLNEGSATAVLAGHANGLALDEQRAESQ